MMKQKVYVIGVGMTKFEKPGRRDNFDYPDMAKEAVDKALIDAKLPYSAVQQACVGYVYGDSTCGQRALYQIGMTGIPIYNVNNNCSTGSTALLMAKQLIEGGVVDCAMALGFEKMQRGSLSSTYSDRSNPMEKHVEIMSEIADFSAAPITPQMFGNAGVEHMKKYGTKLEHFAKIAEKNHKHSVNNPNSQFRDEYTLDQIMKSPMVHSPLTKLQCCPTSDGGACAILASEAFVRRHGLEGQAVEVLALEMATDIPSTFADKSSMKLVGYDMSKKAAEAAYRKAGVGPEHVNVIELHDCFSANELITYEALGLCPPGGAAKMIDRGDNTYGGKYVINPSGGLISKGHPLGATGIAQCAELCWQLRGTAGPRQVAGAKVALQHNVGLGGACVVGIYKMGFPHGYDSVRERSQVSAYPTAASGASPDDFQSSVIFQRIEDGLKIEGPAQVKKMKAVFCFKVSGGKNGAKAQWIVDAKNGDGKVVFQGTDKADCTVSMSDDDMVKMMTGKLNPQQAFFQGKLKLAGNIGLAMKLKDFIPAPGKSKL